MAGEIVVEIGLAAAGATVDCVRLPGWSVVSVAGLLLGYRKLDERRRRQSEG